MIIPADYARYSTDNQREESIEDQQRLNARRCEQEGWPIPIHYSDNAVSGQSKDRQGFDQLLTDAEAKRFNVLLVTALSRLGRDSAEREMVIRRLEFWGIRIIAVSEGYDTNLPLNVRKMHRGMSGIKDEAFIDDVSRETHRGMIGKVTAGFNVSGKRYGYKHNPIESDTKKDKFGRPAIVGVQLEINQDEAEIIRLIYTMFAQGNTPYQIASHLNEQGIPSPKCGTWSRSSIYPDKRGGIGILSNEIYHGWYIWNRTKWVKNPDTGKRKSIPRPESEWEKQYREELIIIDDDLWQAVQAQIEASRNEAIAKKLKGKGSAGGRQPKYLLSGLLKCGVCGGNFSITTTSRHQLYGCGRRKDGGHTVCSNHITVPRLVAEERLLDGIKNKLMSAEAVKIFRQAANRMIREMKKRDPTKQTRQELAQMETKIDNMVQAIQDGAYSKSLQTALTEAEEKRDNLTQQIQAQTQAASALPDILPNMEAIYMEKVNRLEQALIADVTQARAQVREILGNNIPLHPTQEGHLEAELTVEGIIKMTAGSDCQLFDNGGSGGQIRTDDLRVMSPTSYQAAPPRIRSRAFYREHLV